MRKSDQPERRERGSIRQLDDKGRLWEVVVFLRREGGIRKYRYARVKGSKSAAERKRTELLGQRDAGTLTQPSRETLGAYLDRWLESKRTSVSARSAEGYTYLLATHVRPALASRRLASLTPLDIQSVYDAMTKRGLTGGTVHQTHTALRQALAQAVLWRVLAHNPCDSVNLPRKQVGESSALTVEEARALLVAAAEHQRAEIAEKGTRALLWIETYFHVALSVGARPNELLALGWDAVDLERGQVHIHRALEWLRQPAEGQSAWSFKEPKAHGQRTVSLPATVIERLRRLRAEQAKAALKRKPEQYYVDRGLVFAGRFGDPVETRNLASRHLKPILKAAKLPESVRLYDLRHTCATLLAAAGENPKVIAERLGHASTDMTLNRYTHVSPGMQERATERLATALYRD